MKSLNQYVCLGFSLLLTLSSCGDDDGGGAPAIEPIIISSDFNENTELENHNPAEGEPDYIIDGFLSVNAELTVQPGVCVVFTANSGLFVDPDGMIQAIGTAAKPIKFTGEQKEPGFWRGVQVRTNDVRNEFNHVILEYAGSDFLATYGTSIELSGGLAIEGVTGFYGSMKVHNTTIQDCMGYGLIVEQHALLREFSNNVFSQNTESAIRIDVDNVRALDSETTFSSNGFDGVEINASGSPTHDLTQDATWVPLNNAAYRVEQSFDAIATLTIMAGTTIEFEANQTAVFKQDFSGPNDGILIAIGTEADPITFTGAESVAGYWQGLIVQSNSLLNEIDHCIVEYGGSDLINGQLANISLDKDGAFESPDLIVTNSIIRNSAGCGISVEGNLTASDNTFSDNATSNICL